MACGLPTLDSGDCFEPGSRPASYNVMGRYLHVNNQAAAASWDKEPRRGA